MKAVTKTWPAETKCLKNGGKRIVVRFRAAGPNGDEAVGRVILDCGVDHGNSPDYTGKVVVSVDSVEDDREFCIGPSEELEPYFQTATPARILKVVLGILAERGIGQHTPQFSQVVTRAAQAVCEEWRKVAMDLVVRRLFALASPEEVHSMANVELVRRVMEV
jgi:hypothetical protein